MKVARTKSRTTTPKGKSSNVAPRGRFADLDEDKLRGGYYTSSKVAEWLCGWAIQSAEDVVLEPSCGDGAFLEAAAHRLRELGGTPEKIGQNLTGVEIIPAEAEAATTRLQGVIGKSAEKVVQNSDFFAWWADSLQPAFDAIIGNPPFIRYQSFPEPHRTIAMQIMGDQGLTPNRLTNIWVPFVVAATASLKAGGRLALVLPAEILQVTYAAQLRSYLTDHFERIDVIACNELFFEKAEQEVVLLLADGALATASEDNTCRVSLTAAATVADITDVKPALILDRAEPKTIRHDSEKWLKYFLDNRQITFMRALRDAAITTPMSTHASIDVGVVTGKNEFFVLSANQVEDLGLEGYTTPLVSRSAQLKGSKIEKADWRSLSAGGDRVHLLNISKAQASKLSAKLRRYIEEGERKEFHMGYKCSIREPWYLVPSVWVPDGFAFRQIYDFPRMVLNSSGATSTDTIHRMRSHGAKPERVIANTYTWLTAASAEIEGRSYGGGVLELEPTEAERLLMPAQLNGAMPLTEVDQLVRAGRLDDVLEENAKIILREHMGLTSAECDLFEERLDADAESAELPSAWCPETYSMTAVDPKDAARARVADLVQNFRRNEADYLRAAYNETQARTDFITPLLAAFGWDVHNVAGQPLGLREVIEEATVEVGEERLSKKPDYELRLARQRKLFVEAKKPNVRIDRSRDAAFQTRRYGYSASLPISILTNFHQLAVYDCRPSPNNTDEAHVARILLVGYEEFEARFDELWPLLSREAVYSGDFDRRFAVDVTRHGADQFDDFFLRQVRSWRERLARDIHQQVPGLSPDELTYAVQLFLSRIVFLRICEDRDIERYETLRGLTAGNSFDALMKELRRADAFYDSGLFRLLDDARLGIRISDDVLSGIINELYYPQSPYTFAVVETEVLGEIYEQFLGEIITIDAHGNVEIVSKPEVRDSGGVVPTPRYIVDAIVQRTLGPKLAGQSPADLAAFTVADICCGSGIFLLSVFEFLTDHYLSWYLANDRANHVGRTIYEAGAGLWRLTFEEKRRILLAHVRGVDIDTNAVEVARFSLLLKLIEDESEAGLREYVDRTGTPALPELDGTLRAGNSLVSQAEWVAARGALPARLLDKVNPFSWAAEFPAESTRGGFDVIVGNPPYIRIQNMQTYSPEEAAFYQSAGSPYTTARQDNFDKYALFIERSLGLVRPDGRLGFIVPHKFMTIQAGRALRRLVTAGHPLEEIVHFGVQQVFGRLATNYTCLLILDRQGKADVTVERVDTLDLWRYGTPGPRSTMPAAELTDDPWQFADAATRALFARVRAACGRELGEASEIFVGVQTSADAIYIFREVSSTPNTVTLRWDGRDWPIERDILRPCLLDVTLHPYARAEANTWMIFPYEIVNGARTTAQLIQPADMARRFPLCLAYLTARQADLQRRNIVGGTAATRQFYQFGRSQSLTKFDSPKIILPILSREARYAYDDTNIMMTGGGNGPYYLIRPRDSAPETNFFLLAVLHHPLSEAMVRTHTSPFRGGYYSHGKQFIEHLPIPPATPPERANIEALVMQLIAANDAAQVARVPHQKTLHERNAAALRDQIEGLVTALFGLSPADMALARAVPIPA